MAAEIHREPADDYGHGAVAAHRDEEEGGELDVPGFFAVVGEEDGEAGDCDADGY